MAWTQNQICAAVAIAGCMGVLAGRHTGPTPRDPAAEEYFVDVPATYHADMIHSPEPLNAQAFCAEKCKYVQEMCHGEKQGGKWNTVAFPAPSCTERSTSDAEDIFIHNPTAWADRNQLTRRLAQWGGRQARMHRFDNVPETSKHEACEQIPFVYQGPMMHPDEFEFMVKTMINLKPKTYLEWGSGKSTSFYPLMVSGHTWVIDGYPPWCAKTSEDPTVKCMIDNSWLTFVCSEPHRADGSSIKLNVEGRLPKFMGKKDANTVADQYVNAIENTGTKSFDAALIDGRFRVAAALKLLPYLHDKSVLFMHDFWRRPNYHAVFDYYDAIGYARSSVALVKKKTLPADWETAYLKHMHDYL